MILANSVNQVCMPFDLGSEPHNVVPIVAGECLEGVTEGDQLINDQHRGYINRECCGSEKWKGTE